MSLFPRTLMGISMFPQATGTATGKKVSVHSGADKGLKTKGKAKK